MSVHFAHMHDGSSYTGRTNVDGGTAFDKDAPLVIALHGGSYTSEYFDIRGHSLLDNASERGIPVIALDRPNYGGSSALSSEGSIIFANAVAVSEAISSIRARDDVGFRSVVLIGHSIGAAIATKIAATPQEWPLVGLATSGCLVRGPEGSENAWADLPDIPLIELPAPLKDQIMFGPAHTFGEDMPEASHRANTTVPRSELIDIAVGWMAARAEVCARVTVPVHHRQGEFDVMWATDQQQLDEYAAGFASSPRVDARLHPASGHCIDFHLSSDAFQRSQLEFALATATMGTR